MSWATGRRMLILAIVGGVLLLVIGGITFLSLYKAPSCTDGKQSKNEDGIDCGGVCTYLCAAPVGLAEEFFTRAIPNGSGRADVIAYIKNPNPSAAAKNVRYAIELYSSDRAVIAKKEGVVDIAPGVADTVIFIPNFFSGNQTIDRAFLTLDKTSFQWFVYDAPLSIPLIKVSEPSGTTNAPRVSAIVTNPFVTPLRNIKLIATVFNGEGNAIAASQTVIPELLPQASTQVVFTWNVPFSDAVSRIDVRPIVPVPAP